MRADPGNFSISSQQLDSEQRFVIEIAFDSAATILRYFTSHSDAALPTGAVVQHGVVESFSSTSQALDQLVAKATIGDISFSILDYGEDLTNLLNDQLINNSRSVRDKRVRVYAGHKNAVWADYILVATQFMSKRISYKDGLYTFECRDIQRESKIEIFNLNDTNLAANLTSTSTYIQALSVTGFEMFQHDSSYSDAPSTTCGYIKISKSSSEFEIIRYEGIDSGLNRFTTITRARFGTKELEIELDGAASPDKQPKIEEFVYLEGHGPKLEYALRTGDLMDQPGQTLPSNWHMGIDSAYIRLADRSNMDGVWYDSSDPDGAYKFYFAGLEKTKGKEFIEKELLLAMSMFSPVYADGSLGLKMASNIISGSSAVIELNKHNVISYGDLTYEQEDVNNNIEMFWNWDFINKRYTRRNNLLDSDSSLVYGYSKTRSLSFKGISGDIHVVNVLNSQFASIRDRYTGPPILIEVTCFASVTPVEIGDIVRVKLDQVKDHTGNVTSLDKPFEVRRVVINWIDGTVTLSLFASSRPSTWVKTDSTSGSVISDSWYTSSGTDLNSLPNITGNQTTGNQSLTGATALGGASGKYYCNGNFTINAAHTIDWTNNVILVIKGVLTINGTLYGIGGGMPGGVAPAPNGLPSSHTDGGTGFLGNTQSGGGIIAFGGRTVIAVRGHTQAGINSELPNFAGIKWDGSDVKGLPKDLRGTGGASGHHTVSTNALDNVTTYAKGGNGGAGGGGLIIICRDISFGAGGSIKTSGITGSFGESLVHSFTVPGIFDGEGRTTGNTRFYAGSGAGGAPGGLLIIQDGNTLTYPDITTSTFVAEFGDTPIPAPPLTSDQARNQKHENGYSIWVGTGDGSSWEVDGEIDTYTKPSMSGLSGAARVVYMPPYQAPEGDVPEDTNPPTGISFAFFSNTPQSLTDNLGTIEVTVTPPADSNYSYSKVYARKLASGDPWEYVGATVSNKVNAIVAMNSDIWEFEARGVSDAGKETPTGERNNYSTPTTSGGATLDSGNYFAVTKTSYADASNGIWIGMTGSTPLLNIGDATTYMKWNGSALTVKGTITITDGAAGGWTLTATEIRNASGTVSIDSANEWIQTGPDSSNYTRMDANGIIGVTTAHGTAFNLKTDGTDHVIGGWKFNGTKIFNTLGTVTLDAANNRIQCGPDASNYVRMAPDGLVGYTVTKGTAFHLKTDGTDHLIGGWSFTDTKIFNTAVTLELDAANNRIQAGPSSSTYVRISPSGITGVDAILGMTFNIPTDGSNPTFSSGIIDKTVFKIYTSGVIKTADAPDVTGGVLINSAGVKAFDSSGNLKTFIDATDGSIEVYTNITGKRIEINPSGDNEIHFYGNTGLSVEEAATIGLKTYGADEVIGSFGTSNSYKVALRAESTTTNAIRAYSTSGSTILVSGGSGHGIEATNNAAEPYSTVNAINSGSGRGVTGHTSTGYGVVGYATGAGYGVAAACDASASGKAPFIIERALDFSAAPTHAADRGAFWVDYYTFLYFKHDTGTVWHSIPFGNIKHSYTGSVTGGATPSWRRQPFSWTLTRVSAGVVKITHNLITPYASCIPAIRGATIGYAQPDLYNSNDFTVRTFDLSGTPTDMDFDFIVAFDG